MLENPQDATDSSLVDKTEDALLGFAQAHAVTPPPALKASILEKLKTLAAQKRQTSALNLNQLPLLEEHSNWLDWQAAVADILPPEEYDDIHLHTLESDDKRELFVAFVKEFVPEEVHYDLIESFLLLEGSCECHITNEAGETCIVRMGQGDLITMKIGEKHDIHITSSSPAKAILQWKKLAA